MRLMIPCRALTCSHLQCFDATLYIQMNEKKPTWVCPVCDKKAPYEHLIIDGLFVEILNSCMDCDEIQFKEDGSWAPMRNLCHFLGQRFCRRSLTHVRERLQSARSSSEVLLSCGRTIGVE
uniref:SP-RING-type domain-containing protein n=1 Tax=Oryzias sinensis TaxID=183150 RepID=A0A8C8DQS6_9TELE